MTARLSHSFRFFFFFFNDTATTEIYTLSLHDALPISVHPRRPDHVAAVHLSGRAPGAAQRSEEHTSELQSQSNLVCRLLLEKKKKKPSQPFLPRTVVSDRTRSTPPRVPGAMDSSLESY